MGTSTAIYMVFTAALVPLVGITLAITPWLMRGNECFAVTIPASERNDPAIRGYKRGYTLWTALIAVLLTAISALLFVFVSHTAGLVATIASTLLLTAASFGLMLFYRKKVRRLKERMGWQASADVRSTVVGEREVPRPISPWWAAINVPVILVTLAVGIAGYGSMPDLVPVHMDFDGQVNGWAEKSPLVILFAPIFQVFMTAVFTFTLWAITHSKRPNAPGAPVSSAYAYGRFARAQSVFMLAMGFVLNVASIAIQLSMVGAMDLGVAGGVVMVAAVVAVVGAIVLAVVYGQSGARAMAQPSGDGGLLYDDDRYWKLGVFYVNPQDPSLFVPKRFGVGWTSNFGRPATWLIIVGMVLAIVAFLLVIRAIL